MAKNMGTRERGVPAEPGSVRENRLKVGSHVNRTHLVQAFDKWKRSIPDGERYSLSISALRNAEQSKGNDLSVLRGLERFFSDTLGEKMVSILPPAFRQENHVRNMPSGPPSDRDAPSAPSKTSSKHIRNIAPAFACDVNTLATIEAERLNIGDKLKLYADRFYLVSKTVWRYRPSADGRRWDGEYEAERRLICLVGGLKYIVFSFATEDHLHVFDVKKISPPQLVEAWRQDTGDIEVRKPYRQRGSAYAFRVHFEPELRPGEEAYIRVTFGITDFKFSTLKQLRRANLKASGFADDYQLHRFPITYPTKSFELAVAFDIECGAKFLSCDVLVGSTPLPLEQEMVRQNHLTIRTRKGVRTFSVTREFPPINTCYYLKWQPPEN